MIHDHRSDVRWFICCSAAALGERGTSGQMIDLLKFGAPASNGEPPMPYSDEQLGFGSRDTGHVRRWRRCQGVWRRMEQRPQTVLWARHDSRQWDPGVAAAFDVLSGVVALRVHDKHGDNWRVELARASQSLGRDAVRRRDTLRAEAEREVESAMKSWAEISVRNARSWAEGAA